MLRALTQDNLQSVVNEIYSSYESKLKDGVTEQDLLEAVKKLFLWSDEYTHNGKPLYQYDGKYVFGCGAEGIVDQMDSDIVYDLFEKINEKLSVLDIGDEKGYVFEISYPTTGNEEADNAIITMFKRISAFFIHFI